MNFGPDYKVYILDINLQRVTQVKNLVTFDDRGNVLRYSKLLSGYGFCNFRIGKNDPIWQQFGDIIKPWQYGVQVVRGNVVVWQGLIVNNPHMQRNYYDVMARGYLVRYNKLQINHDPETAPGDGLDNYRTFRTGTMAAAITAVFNESKAKVGSADILQSITLGTIENPTFPSYFVKADGSPMVGDWTFSDDITLQYDYKSVFYFFQSMGVYSSFDFEITDQLAFNFRKRIGDRRPDLTFYYGRNGNILDYDAPRNGDRTTNDLMGIASDIEGNVLHINQRDETSIGKIGLLQDVEAFLDVKEKNALRVRLAEEARFVSTPDSVVNIVLNEKAYPLGLWNLGDTATIRIKDGILDINEERRITGYVVTVHNTGREMTTIETNEDRST